MSKKNHVQFIKNYIYHAQALKKKKENSKRIEEILFFLHFIWLRVEKWRDEKD